MSFSVIPNSLMLSAENLRLGEFTNNISAPHEEHHFPTTVESPPLITTEFQYRGLGENASETRFRSALSSIIVANLFKKSQRTFYVAPGRAKRYLLENLATWFRRAIDAESTKRWIQERALEGDNIYMITGIQTLINPRITLDSSSATQADSAVSVPVDLVSTVRLVQPVLEGAHQTNATKNFEFAVEGERLLALEYRKVNFKWLHRLNTTEPRLSSTTRSWNCLETVTRGNGRGDNKRDSSSENGDGDGVGNALEVIIAMENTIPNGDWIQSKTANMTSYIIPTFWAR